MKSPEEHFLLIKYNSNIKRTRAISRLLTASDITIEQSIRVTGALQEAESECQKTENALQTLSRTKTFAATSSTGR